MFAADAKKIMLTAVMIQAAIHAHAAHVSAAEPVTVHPGAVTVELPAEQIAVVALVAPKEDAPAHYAPCVKTVHDPAAQMAHVHAAAAPAAATVAAAEPVPAYPEAVIVELLAELTAIAAAPKEDAVVHYAPAAVASAQGMAALTMDVIADAPA